MKLTTLSTYSYFRNLFALALILLSTFALNAQTTLYQNAITKCYNGPTLNFNNTTGTALPSVNFVSGIDIPLGHRVVDVIVEIVWSKTDDGTCTAITGNASDLSHVGFQISGPVGGPRYLAASATTSAFAGTTESFAGTFPGATMGVVGDTIVFRDGYPSLVPAGLPNYPQRDTVSPNADPLSFYIGSVPYGSWTIRAIDDLPGVTSPSLCIHSYCITLVTCLNTSISAVCLGAPSVSLDAAGTHVFQFADLDNGSDISCITKSIVFSPASVNCSSIGTPVSVTMTLTDQLDSVASCISMVNVVDTTPLQCIINSINMVSCFGGTDGAIGVSGTGGVPPYVYSFNGGSATTTNLFTGLAAGTYSIQVIDANGCSSLINPTITQPSALSISFSGPDTICIGATTSITAIANGGVSGYSFLWNNGSISNPNAPISTGVYCVTINDANGCTTTDCKTIAESNFEVTFNANNTLYNSLNQAFGITLPTQPYTIQTQSNAPSTLYTWTPSAGLSSTTIPNPTAVVLNSTTYYLESVDATTGCIDLDTIMIYVHQTDISSIEIAPDSSVLHCTDIPIMMSAGSSTAAVNSTSNYGSTTSPSFGCFEYTSNGTAPEVVDTIVWINCDSYYSPIAFTYIPICDTNIVYITTASCVWAGDTDDDGIANNMDLLPIGLHHSATGTTRANASTNYTCQPARNWNVGTLGNPTVDIKHIDCDGNGTINDIDTNAIILNWAQTHVKNLSTNISGIEIYIDTLTAMPGNTISLPIVLGDALNPSLGYGIAFTIHYDVMGVDTNSVSIDFSNSWLGTIGSDMIGISKDFYSAGHVQVAMTRTDHNSVMGGGVIGHIDLTIKDDVLPKSAFVRLDFEITDVRFIDNLGDTIQTLPLPSQILIVDNWLSNKTIENSNKISVFPNPTGSLLNIQSLNENIEMIQVLDLTGKIVLEQSSVHSLQNVLDMNFLGAGVYVLTVQTESGVEMVRVIKN